MAQKIVTSPPYYNQGIIGVVVGAFQGNLACVQFRLNGFGQFFRFFSWHLRAGLLLKNTKDGGGIKDRIGLVQPFIAQLINPLNHPLIVDFITFGPATYRRRTEGSDQDRSWFLRSRNHFILSLTNWKSSSIF